MTKKKWTLLILCVLLLAGYLKLFYKTWSNDTVAQNADCIITLDVKKITNTIIWDFITTPSQWNKSSVFSSSKKDEVSWDDMVKLPDYVFVFHIKGQPTNAWYTVLQINDMDDFSKGLQQYHFKKTIEPMGYFSKELGIELIQNGNNLLLANAAVVNKAYIRELANELFVKKQYIAKDILHQNIKAVSHLSIQVRENDLFEMDHMATVNFNSETIRIDAGITPYFNVNLSSHNFTYSDSSLCTLAFTQPYPDVKMLLKDSLRAKISTAINFDIDSMLLQSNSAYQLTIEGIHSRIDSAINYTYDDDFNPVEKVVVNAIEEPALNFAIEGDSVQAIHNYWKRAGKLEKTAAGDWFTPLPFVRSYCSISNQKQLSITSRNYKEAKPMRTEDCILLLQLLLTKIPSSLIKYLPEEVVKATKNIESVKAMIRHEKGGINLQVIFNKKKNDLPIIEW